MVKLNEMYIPESLREDVKKLTFPQLVELDETLHRLLEDISGEMDRERERTNVKGCYSQQFTRCGKKSCKKCSNGPGHGPYWYRFFTDGGKKKSEYIGKALPVGIEAM